MPKEQFYKDISFGKRLFLMLLKRKQNWEILWAVLFTTTTNVKKKKENELKYGTEEPYNEKENISHFQENSKPLRSLEII